MSKVADATGERIEMALLPESFEDLEEFVPYWDVPTTNERWDRRAAASYPEIERFYEAMFARAEDATVHCEAFPLDAMPAESERLARLLLALTHAATAVELHRSPRVRHAPFPHMLSVEQGFSPFA